MKPPARFWILPPCSFQSRVKLSVGSVKSILYSLLVMSGVPIFNHSLSSVKSSLKLLLRQSCGTSIAHAHRIRCKTWRAVVSIKKQYLKTRAACRVTFSLPKKAAAFANTVHLVGDFNDWNKSITPMKRLKNGSFTTTLVLRRNKEYQFRYLLDGLQWENDWKADKYVPNRYGSENSVVVVS